MSKKVFFILTIIIFIASILRLWQLGTVPIAPDWDEVSLGYNAYSIMHTGRDEYGKFLPIILRSFDDYKPALYTYLTIPSIAIFGLNVFAVRLPSAIFGILTVVATYFLVLELFKIKKWEMGNGKIDNEMGGEKKSLTSHFKNPASHISLLTSFLIAISPWHIHFSRVAFESNIGVAFNVFGVLFFLKGLKKPFYLLASSMFFSLNLYAYQSEKVFVPLFVICLIVIYRKELFSLPKKYIASGLLIGMLIILPLIIFSITNKNTFERFKGVSFLSDKTQLLKDSVQKEIQDKNKNDTLGLLLDNRRIVYVKTLIAGYISHFDLNWLFIKGDFGNNRHHAPNMGLLYLWELPFLLFGVYTLVFGKFGKKTTLLVFSWFLIPPISASITTDVPHAVRTLDFLTTFKIFTAIGIVTFITTVSNIKNKILNIQIKYLIFTMFFLFFIFNFLYYLDQYFVQLNYFYAKDWKYGYQELVEYLKPIHNKYKKVIVSNVAPLDQSYMFFLFYLKHDPASYLREGGTLSGGFKEKNSFSNFEFRKFNYYDESGKTLFVGTDQDFSELFKEIKRIKNPDGSVAIRVVEKE